MVITHIPQSQGNNALRHTLVQRLLGSIFDGRLRAGSKLAVLRLAKEFGTSSTPVREALVELASAGMVEFVHRRGVVVKPLGPRELRDIHHLRRVLEAEATKCATSCIGMAELEPLEEKLQELVRGPRGSSWSEQAIETDHHLHELIVERCGSERIAHEIGRYSVLIQAIRNVVGNPSGAQLAAVREHLVIVQALIAADANAASAAMGRHIDNSARIAEMAMFE